jgi:hypothetical protein
MWCTSCRQDVPGLSDGVDSGYGCARCGAALLNDSGIDLSAEAPEPPRRAGSYESAEQEPVDNYRDDLRDDLRENIPFEPAAPPQAELTHISTLRWDAANWELSEKLRHVERLTAGGSSARGPASHRSGSGYASRYDAPASRLHAPHYPTGEAAPPNYEPSRFEPYSPAESPWEHPPLGAPYSPPSHPPHPHAPHPPAGAPPTHNEAADWIEAAASLTSWLFLGLAVGTFCCGGFLAAWGAIAERKELEQLGMPIILGGMLALVLGLLPQIFLRRVEEGRTRERRQEPEYGRAPETYGSRTEHWPHSDYGRHQSRQAESPYYR